VSTATAQQPPAAGATPEPPALPQVPALAVQFGQRADISARSVLVTIFGDSVVPTGGEVWLGDLIGLVEPFGFSDRLVRTSMFRLTAEGWFDIERVGRRSRYRLTPAATDEFAAAEARIYHRPRPSWDGMWTLVFLDAELPREQREPFERAMRTLGYVRLATGVLGAPRADDPAVAPRVARRVGLAGPLPVAAARFPDLASLVSAGWPGERLESARVAARYHDVVARYAWTRDLDAASLGDSDAFLARTMLVHELRRARLDDPDLPAELCGPGWPADAVMELAADAYRVLSPGAWRWFGARSALATRCRHDRRFG